MGRLWASPEQTYVLPAMAEGASPCKMRCHLSTTRRQGGRVAGTVDIASRLILNSSKVANTSYCRRWALRTLRAPASVGGGGRGCSARRGEGRAVHHAVRLRRVRRFCGPTDRAAELCATWPRSRLAVNARTLRCLDLVCGNRLWPFGCSAGNSCWLREKKRGAFACIRVVFRIIKMIGGRPR